METPQTPIPQPRQTVPDDGQQPASKANPDVANKENVLKPRPLTRPEDVDLSVIFIHAPDINGKQGTFSLLDLFQMGLGIETYRWFIRNLVSNVLGLEEGEPIKLITIQRMVSFLENLGFTIVRAKKEFIDEQSAKEGAEKTASAETAPHKGKDVKGQSRKAGDKGQETSGKDKTAGKSKQGGKPKKNGK